MLSHAVSHRKLKYLFHIQKITLGPTRHEENESTQYQIIHRFLFYNSCIAERPYGARRTSQSESDGWLWPHHDLQDRRDRLTDNNTVCCRFVAETCSCKINDYFLPSQRPQQCLASHEAPFIISLSRVKSRLQDFQSKLVR